jgi:hypothetical protein
MATLYFIDDDIAYKLLDNLRPGTRSNGDATGIAAQSRGTEGS